MHTIPDERHESVDLSPGDWILFVIAIFVGTLAAAAMNGLIHVGVAGVIFGPIVVIVVGIPAFLTTAVLAWSLWLFRFPLGVAVCCGAVTGLVCTLRMYDSILGLPLAVSAILATFLGGGGAGIAGGWFLRSTSARRRIAALGKTPTRQFTPGWIFLHLGAFAVVMAFWFWTIGDLRTKIELMRQQQIDRPRRSGRGSD